MRATVLPWGELERDRLRRARFRAGHSQEQCADVLVSRFGVSSASQATVNRWESGIIKRPRCIEALAAYSAAYDPAPDVGVSPEPDPLVESGARSQSEAAQFEQLAGRAAGEPLIGPMQAELVRAAIQRLASGPPMSADDRLVYMDLSRVLRLEVSD